MIIISDSLQCYSSLGYSYYSRFKKILLLYCTHIVFSHTRYQIWPDLLLCLSSSFFLLPLRLLYRQLIVSFALFSCDVHGFLFVLFSFGFPKKMPSVTSNSSDCRVFIFSKFSSRKKNCIMEKLKKKISNMNTLQFCMSASLPSGLKSLINQVSFQCLLHLFPHPMKANASLQR